MAGADPRGGEYVGQRVYAGDGIGGGGDRRGQAGPLEVAVSGRHGRADNADIVRRSRGCHAR